MECFPVNTRVAPLGAPHTQPTLRQAAGKREGGDRGAHHHHAVVPLAHGVLVHVHRQLPDGTVGREVGLQHQEVTAAIRRSKRAMGGCAERWVGGCGVGCCRLHEYAGVQIGFTADPLNPYVLVLGHFSTCDWVVHRFSGSEESTWPSRVGRRGAHF